MTVREALCSKIGRNYGVIHVMFEKPQNLRDALELIRMFEHLFGSISRTNEQVPWRGVELTLRQIALSILDSMEESAPGCYAAQPAAPSQSQNSFSPQGASYTKKPSEGQAAQAEEKETTDTTQTRFRSRPTVVDRVQASPVSGYKSKSFGQE